MSALRIFARIFAVLLIALYVAIMPALVLAYDVQVVVLDGRFLEQAAADSRVYDEVLVATAEGLAYAAPQDANPEAGPLARLDAQEWEQILRVMAPPATLQRWTQDGAVKFRRWLRDGDSFLEDVTLPFGEMRDNLVNDPAHTALRTILDAQPVCATNQESLAGPDDLVPDCKPAGEDARGTLEGRLAERWSARPRELWAQLWPGDVGSHPDNVTLAEFNVSRGGADLAEMRSGLDSMRALLTFSRWLMLGLALALSLVLVGLVALLAARNPAEAVRWAGVPLAPAGAVTLLLAWPVRLAQDIGAFTFSPGEAVTRVQADVIANAFGRPFAGDLWPLLAMHGGILLAIGVTLWVASFFIPVRRPAAAAAPTPEILR